MSDDDPTARQRHYPGAFELLFWSKTNRPHDHVRPNVPDSLRELVATFLELGGTSLISYMGWADCRICGAHLGTVDMGITTPDGARVLYVWPEKAEHYLRVHKVWTPECDEICRAIRAQRSPIP